MQMGFQPWLRETSVDAPRIAECWARMRRVSTYVRDYILVLCRWPSIFIFISVTM